MQQMDKQKPGMMPGFLCIYSLYFIREQRERHAKQLKRSRRQMRMGMMM
jgi:hypothetical protein